MTICCSHVSLASVVWRRRGLHYLVSFPGCNGAHENLCVIQDSTIFVQGRFILSVILYGLAELSRFYLMLYEKLHIKKKLDATVETVSN